MLDAVDDALMAVNENEEISFCNRACEVLLGYRPQELLGSPLKKVFPGDAGESLTPLMADLSGDTALSGSARIHPGLTLYCADGRRIASDVLQTLMEMEDELLSVLILRPETSRGGEALPVPAMALIEEMNRNRDRLQSLEESLNGLIPKVLEGHPGFLRELRAIDAALDQVSHALSDDRDIEDRRRLIVAVMTLSLDYWAEATGTMKVDLAEQSGLWKVYTNLDGWERTQTLDRYLDVQTLPRKPRRRQVIRTAEFVLAACDTESGLRQRLEAALTNLRILS
jgi:two-component system, sensor histidine kinase ChiS